MYQDSCSVLQKPFKLTVTVNTSRCFLWLSDPQEFGELVVGRKSIETEKETLVERVKASKRVIEAGRRESLYLEKQVKDLEKRLRCSQGETRAAEEKLQTFLKEVASVLHVKSETLVQPTEQDVLNKVESLCNKVRNIDFQQDIEFHSKTNVEKGFYPPEF